MVDSGGMTDTAPLPLEQRQPPIPKPVPSSDEGLLRTLGDAAPGFMWIVDGDGQFVYANRTWQAYTGSSLDQLNSIGWEQFNHPDELAEVRRRWSEAMAEGTQFEMELRYRRHDGEYHWMLARVCPLRNGDGQVQ